MGNSMRRGLTTRGRQHIVESSETLQHFSGSYGQASPLTKSVHLELVPRNPPLPSSGYRSTVKGRLTCLLAAFPRI
jgi:hypothetical protein